MGDDPFFSDLMPRSSCWMCQHDAEAAFLDDLLRGMAGIGPYASKVSPKTGLIPLLRRFKNKALMEERGLQQYPRERSAFETHCKQHRQELWDAVEAARRS